MDPLDLALRSAALAGVLLAATPATADVIPAGGSSTPTCPALTCPPGTQPFTTARGHGACPSACAVTPPCETAATCAPVYGRQSQCVPTRFCAGMSTGGDIRDIVRFGECGADGSCAEGECQETKRCTSPPPAAATADDDDGGGCAVGGSGASPPWLAVIGALVFVLRRRVRRRRLTPAARRSS